MADDSSNQNVGITHDIHPSPPASPDDLKTHSNSSQGSPVVQITVPLPTPGTPSPKSLSCPPKGSPPSSSVPSVNKIPFSSAVAERKASTWFTRLNPFPWLHSWRPTSMNQLLQAETRMLRLVRAKLDRFFVNVCNDKYRIWTLIATKVEKQKDVNSCKGTPLVLIHGMGGGSGIWAMNLDDLVKDRTVYSFDLLGFGLSSRPTFCQSAPLVEAEFVDSVESWRHAVQLEKPFILLGHSLGGYVAANYAMKYPDRVKHLILVDPWGVQEMPKERELERDWPFWVKALRVVLKPFNPLAPVRGAGPWGPSLIKKFRPDFHRRYSQLFEDDTVFNYIYHLNAQSPSGEAAFKTLLASYGYAKYPLVHRIGKLDQKVSMTFVYGAKSWITSDTGRYIQQLRQSSYVDVQEVKGAGHHVYADRPSQFNLVINDVCKFVDVHSSDINANDCCVPPPEDAFVGDETREKPRVFAPLKAKKNGTS